MQTAEGELAVEIPQVREAAEPFVSKLFPRGTKLLRTEPLKAMVPADVRSSDGRKRPSARSTAGSTPQFRLFTTVALLELNDISIASGSLAGANQFGAGILSSTGEIPYSLFSPEVTRRRMYYETMERILSKVDKTIVETPGVTPYLPLPQIQKSKPQGGAQQ